MFAWSRIFVVFRKLQWFMCAPFSHTNPCRRRMPSSCCPKQQKHSNVQNSYSRKLVSQTKSPNIVELWRLNDPEKAPAPARPQRWNEWRRRRRNFINQVSQASPYSPYSSFGSSKGPVFCKMRKKDLKKKVCQWLLADVKDMASTKHSHRWRWADVHSREPLSAAEPVKAWTLRFGGLELHPVAAQAGKIQTVQMTKRYFFGGGGFGGASRGLARSCQNSEWYCTVLRSALKNGIDIAVFIMQLFFHPG